MLICSATTRICLDNDNSLGWQLTGEHAMLRLLECCILRSLGQLSESQQIQLTAATPKLRAVFRQAGEWHQIVRAALDLPPNFEAIVQRKWSQYLRTSPNSDDLVGAQSFANELAKQVAGHNSRP